MLRCNDLTLAVPGRVLCRGLTLHVEPGQMWAVLGRNGTGKSTLIHTLAGLAAAESGHIELDGRPLSAWSAKSRALALGVLLQIEEGAYWGTVAEYVLLGRYPHGNGWKGTTREDRDEAQAALDAVGMAELAARKFATLSGGERQRARIAQILAQRPRVFLLDEPLQHLDLAHQGRLLTLIGARARERRESAVMVLHEPLWIGRSCTHAVILAGDGTAEAGPADVVLTRERLEHAYGCTLREVADGEGRCFVPDV